MACITFQQDDFVAAQPFGADFCSEPISTDALEFLTFEIVATTTDATGEFFVEFSNTGNVWAAGDLANYNTVSRSIAAADKEFLFGVREIDTPFTRLCYRSDGGADGSFSISLTGKARDNTNG